ncbi:MAG: hypothetical protein M5R36_27360 [Deltaproteobacteria bacterium]|nr:hypothetical protein [Deltaproteobacteria bacterium]
MKVAISNIAWPIEREAEAAEVLRAFRVGGVEVAPTKCGRGRRMRRRAM